MITLGNDTNIFTSSLLRGSEYWKASYSFGDLTYRIVLNLKYLNTRVPPTDAIVNIDGVINKYRLGRNGNNCIILTFQNRNITITSVPKEKRFKIFDTEFSTEKDTNLIPVTNI